MDIVDVKFKEKEYSFHYRVVGVIVRDNNYLIQNIGGKDYYVLPGGHVRIGRNFRGGINKRSKGRIRDRYIKKWF